MPNHLNIKYKAISEFSAQILSTIKSVFFHDFFSGSEVIFNTNDNKVYGFVSKPNGCFGHSNTIKSPQIINELNDKPIVKICFTASGDALMLTENGQVYRWNHVEINGQYLRPVLIDLMEIIDMSCSYGSILFLTQSGDIYKLNTITPPTQSLFSSQPLMTHCFSTQPPLLFGNQSIGNSVAQSTDCFPARPAQTTATSGDSSFFPTQTPVVSGNQNSGNGVAFGCNPPTLSLQTTAISGSSGFLSAQPPLVSGNKNNGNVMAFGCSPPGRPVQTTTTSRGFGFFPGALWAQNTGILGAQNCQWCGNYPLRNVTNPTVNQIQNNVNPEKITFINEKVAQISCGQQHNLALTESGKLFCWGDNSYGQLGLGHNEKEDIGLINEYFNGLFIRKIICGYNHSLVLTTSGQIYAFGWNRFGELGIGGQINQNKPKLIVNSVKFNDIFADFKYNISMAMSDKGLVYVWGECKEGQYDRPQKTECTSIQEAINNYSRVVFSHKRIEYRELFKSDKSNENNVMSVMDKAFNNPQNSDLKFKIKVNDEFKYIYVQKWFIGENSEHFKTMFSKESNANEIEIKEHSYDCYYAFTKYLYTNCVETEDMNILLELLGIAELYFKEQLKQKCSQMIKMWINVENVCDVYTSAILYVCNDLENYCFDFMVNVGNALIRTDGYKQMDPIYVKHFTTNYIEYISTKLYNL